MNEFGLLVTIIVIVAIIAYVIINGALYPSKSEFDNNKDIRIDILKQIAFTIYDLVESLNDESNLKMKSKYCQQAINKLEEASQYPEYQEVITDFDELSNQLYSITKIIPVVIHLQKAHKYKFKKKDSSEKNALLDALYEIKQNDISNEDFLLLGSHDEETGEVISIEMIEERLKELGWEK